MSDRRRAAAKAKRVRQVKRQLFMITVAVIAVVVGVGTHISKKRHQAETVVNASAQNVKSAEEEKKDITESSEDSQKEVAAIEINETPVEKTETPKERLVRVKKEAIQAGYPEDVIELLSKSKETVDYVENYAVKKDIEPVKTIAELKKGEFPQLLQWDERWGYAPYGTSVVAVCGCGPTCLSMVLSGFTGDASLTPAWLAEYGTNHGYITEQNDTRWVFMTEACREWGITCREKMLDEEEVKQELKAGNPIICSVGPGDFTKIGHFIVLAGYEDGKVIVHDPFSQINSDKRWVYNNFKDQIKCMWTYTKE